jgi:hypothetical protein
MAVDKKAIAAMGRKKKVNVNSILKEAASKINNITNEKKEKVFSGKVIKKAQNRYWSKDNVYQFPEWVAAINQLKKQGFTEAEAFSAITSSREWEDFSFIGDDG